MSRLKRLGLWVGIPLLLAVGVVFLVPAFRVRLLGMLRGEPSFEGRPASAWADDLTARDGARAAASLKKGGKAALPVLMELVRNGSKDVQPKARIVIVQIGDLALPTLGELLQTSAPEDRRLAAGILADMGAVAKPALPTLVRLLNDSDEQVSQAAVAALDKMGPAAAPAVPDLIRFVETGDAPLKNKAAAQLGKLGAHAKQAVPALIVALEEEATRTTASDALTRIGEPALPALAKLFESDKPVAVRAAAVATLGAMGPKADAALPPLAAAVRNAKSGIRGEAATALAQIGLSKEHLPALLEALSDNDEKVRAAAAQTLARLGPDGLPAVPVLVKTLGKTASLKEIGPVAAIELSPLLADKDTRPVAEHFLLQFKEEALPHVFETLAKADTPVRAAVATFLSPAMGPARDIVPKLLVSIRDKEPSVRAGARDSITRFKKEAVPFLQTALRDKEDSVRREAAAILRTLGPEARAAAPALLRTLEDPKEDVRLEVVQALAAMEVRPKEAVTILLEALENKRDSELIFSLLAAHGREASKAAPFLAKALASPDDKSRLAAAFAVSKIGVDEETLDLVLKAVGDKDPRVRVYAIEALGSAGAKAEIERVVPVLIAELAHDKTRGAAVASLTRLGLFARAATPHLLKTAQGDEQLRAACVVALGKIGPGAKEAGPYLSGLLKSADSEVRSATIEAIGRIGITEAVPALETCWTDFAASKQDDAAAAAALALWQVSKSAKALSYLQERMQAKSPDHAVLKALAGVGLPAQNSVPDLMRVLTSDPDMSKRALAAEALGGVGPLANKAIPALVQALKPGDIELRISAAKALAKFEAAADAAVSSLLDMIHDSASPRLRRIAGEALNQIDPEAARSAGVQ